MGLDYLRKVKMADWQLTLKLQIQNDVIDEGSNNQLHDIVMQALKEAQVEPQHELEALKKDLGEERAKSKHLKVLLKNNYSKVTHLRKTYRDHLDDVEKEHVRISQVHQELWEEKKSLQEANEAKDAQILVLSGQIEVYKKELESSKSDANYFERLLCERDGAICALKAELKIIKSKLCDLIKWTFSM